jgi:organic radical activating enzyme
MGQEDAKELAARVKNVLRTDSNPEGYFRHPLSGFHMHMCFTGGEPLMPISQNAIVEMHDEFKNQRGGPIEDTMSNAASNLPRSFTFETNGTKPLTDNFVDYFTNKGKFGEELFFSVSPKLWTVAGEKASRAIKPDVIQQYYDVAAAANLGSNAPVNGQLKFVIGDVEEQWQEMEQVIGELRLRGINWPVWVMPVGAREEDQLATAGDVAKKAFERGYCVAARVHTYLFGNAIGT